ncbi:sigma-54 dependent transcriptional regulator [Methylocystis sp. 9N]|uniref:DNA-binding transcriptional regulator NtrC n=1 Tax=Methylocystis borbori TaxID=3118750 RepID=A0ABU7XMP6_9HYPH
MTSLILIADDDPIQRGLLESTVRRFGYETETAESGEQAIARLTRPGASPVALLILDLVMPDLDGMGVLTRMRDMKLATPVIVQTAHGSIEAVISAMRAGARDFVVKPVGAERLQISIKNALAAEALAGEVRRIDRRAQGALTLKDLAAKSEDMARVIRLGERAAHSSIPVLLEGESGVGKEVVARAIQGASDRRGKPFVAVNCGAPPADLIESLLFGHEKGAFPGAAEKQTGKFLEANGGTLFLDEIGELPLDIQAKLLRVLQEGEIDPAGAKRPARVDIRLMTATSRNLIDLVKRKQFREDLFYRLNVFPIGIPPLRARREDIADLARRFTARFAAEEGRNIRGVTAEALSLLASYDWPGNVRQLENAVFRAVALAEGDELTVAEFPQIAAHVDGFDVRMPPVPAPGARMSAPREREIVRIEIRDPNSMPLIAQNGEIRRLEDVEAETIRFALTHYRGQMSEIARRLGIGRSTLYRKMKEYGLDEDRAETADTLVA